MYAYENDPIVNGFIELSGQPGLIGNDDGSSWTQIANITGCSNSNASVELACMKSVPPRALKRAINVDNVPSLEAPGIAGGTPVVDNLTVFQLAEYTTRGTTGNFAKVVSL